MPPWDTYSICGYAPLRLERRILFIFGFFRRTSENDPHIVPVVQRCNWFASAIAFNQVLYFCSLRAAHFILLLRLYWYYKLCPNHISEISLSSSCCADQFWCSNCWFHRAARLSLDSSSNHRLQHWLQPFLPPPPLHTRPTPPWLRKTVKAGRKATLLDSR